MHTVVFLDLDDTILQTRAKCPPDLPLETAAVSREGEPLSFITSRQQTLWRFLADATTIPVTGRTLDALHRVRLTFSSFAILDFGGVVLLPDRSLDSTWDQRIRPQALAGASHLRSLCALAQKWSDQLGLQTRARIISDFDMPLYVAIKCPLCREHRQTSAVEQLARLQARLEPDLDRDRYFLHANDNNLSLLPRFLGKEKAVQHVLDQHLAGEPRLTLGMGDSLTDAPFLNLCDYAILPCDSQLARHTLVRSIAGDAGVPPHPPGAEV